MLAPVAITRRPLAAIVAFAFVWQKTQEISSVKCENCKQTKRPGLTCILVLLVHVPVAIRAAIPLVSQVAQVPIPLPIAIIGPRAFVVLPRGAQLATGVASATASASSATATPIPVMVGAVRRLRVAIVTTPITFV